MQKTQANYLDSKAEWKTDTRFNGWQSDPIANVGLSVRVANVGTPIAYCQRCAPLYCSLQYISYANVSPSPVPVDQVVLSLFGLDSPPIRRLFAAYLLPIRRLPIAYLPPIGLLAMQPPKNQL
jgi:hypothetical protein